ncbi:MAG: hypothetical protein K6E64_05520 [Lachnospiraceae bacterium]|nr:hypothetical protein [Lachnospiraceae bacterium]
MKKRLLGLMMAAVMTAGLLVGCGSSSSDSSSDSASTETTESTESTEATADASAFDDLKATYGDDVFEADSNYDEYTIIEYTIEDAGATFAATVSRKSDKSEYHVHCMFYGDEQVVVVKDGTVTEDKTGFMETDGPLIVEAAEAANTWVAIQ